MMFESFSELLLRVATPLVDDVRILKGLLLAPPAQQVMFEPS
jgi:hypothetical protein